MHIGFDNPGFHHINRRRHEISVFLVLVEERRAVPVALDALERCETVNMLAFSVELSGKANLDESDRLVLGHLHEIFGSWIFKVHDRSTDLVHCRQLAYSPRSHL